MFWRQQRTAFPCGAHRGAKRLVGGVGFRRSEEHTSELQSRFDLVCRLLLEKKKNKYINTLLLCTTNLALIENMTTPTYASHLLTNLATHSPSPLLIYPTTVYITLDFVAACN